MRKAVLIIVIIGLMVTAAGTGCAARADRSVNLDYLSSVSPGSRFIIFEPEIKMPFFSRRLPYVKHEARLEKMRWQNTMEMAFKAAGHDVYPMKEADKKLAEMNPRFLREKTPFRPPALYSHMRVDRAVFFDVKICARRGKRIREDVYIRIYDTRTGKRIEKLRWRIDLTSVERAEVPPPPET